MNFNGVTLTQINLHVDCLDAGSPKNSKCHQVSCGKHHYFLSHLGLQLLDSKTKLPLSRNPLDS